MKAIVHELRRQVSAAIEAAFGEAGRGVDPQVRVSADARHGDYQSNVAMGLARKLGKKPQEVAGLIAGAFSAEALALVDKPEIAGPGFINLRLRSDALAAILASAEKTAGEADRLGIEPADPAERQTVVTDYSSPNVAKSMHVGHLRGTIIGDTIARVLRFEGHLLIPQNHLGDWGTQFGMVILGLWHMAMAAHRKEPPGYIHRALAELRQAVNEGESSKLAHLRRIADQAERDLAADADGSRIFEPFLDSCRGESLLSLDDIEAAYIYINTLAEAAEGTELAVRLADPKTIAAMMQKGDAQERKAREVAIEVTLRECNDLYQRLGVQLTDREVCGESFYEPLLAGIVEELQLSLAEPRGPEGGLRAHCRRDQGALCVFLEKPDGAPAFKGPQGDPLPMIVQKSDGASLYATTDLAAALYRIAHPVRHPLCLRSARLAEALAGLGGGLGADRVIYVVGAPQKLHFEMLFATVRALGWTKKPDGAEVRLEHVAFGSVLGGDRKMLRTRSGETTKLRDLLDEGIRKAEEQLPAAGETDPHERRGLSDEEIRGIARTVGIAAIKYADLCQNRGTDYVFSWDKMLALHGNTAPYMLYAYARIRSIHRKGQETGRINAGREASLKLEHPSERALALRIAQLSETIDFVGESLLPNVLCDYLYDLAGKFMSFYESCPVLQAPDEATFASRMRLCDLTARALRLGLGLLGIETLERM